MNKNSSTNARQPLPKKRKQKKTSLPNSSQRQGAFAAISSVSGARKPKLTSKGEGLLVCHSEYCMDVPGSASDFAVVHSIRMNVGNPFAFPWLSRLATRFQNYKVKRMRFRYEPSCGTSQTGFIVLSPDFNPTDSAPTSKIAALQYEDSVRAAPWQPVSVDVPKHNLTKHVSLLVRSSVLSENADPLYDLANLFVCAGGSTGTDPLGELWVDYEVELLTPQIDFDEPSYVAARFTSNNVGNTPAKPLGTSVTETVASKGYKAFSYDTSTGIISCSVRGKFLCVFNVNGSGISALSNGVSGGDATTVTLVSQVINSASTIATEVYVVECKENLGDLWQITPSCSATSISDGEYTIVPYYNGNF